VDALCERTISNNVVKIGVYPEKLRINERNLKTVSAPMGAVFSLCCSSFCCWGGHFVYFFCLAFASLLFFCNFWLANETVDHCSQSVHMKTKKRHCSFRFYLSSQASICFHFEHLSSLNHIYNES
jgi:hypothetical protein